MVFQFQTQGSNLGNFMFVNDLGVLMSCAEDSPNHSHNPNCRHPCCFYPRWQRLALASYIAPPLWQHTPPLDPNSQLVAEVLISDAFVGALVSTSATNPPSTKSLMPFLDAEFFASVGACCGLSFHICAPIGLKWGTFLPNPIQHPNPKCLP